MAEMAEMTEMIENLTESEMQVMIEIITMEK